MIKKDKADVIPSATEDEEAERRKQAQEEAGESDKAITDKPEQPA
jgi:hypothetical protein